MEINHETLSKDVSGILEEVHQSLTDRLINDRLESQGSITIEESQFFNKMVSEVLTESIEEFIPMGINIPDSYISHENIEESSNNDELSVEAPSEQEQQIEESYFVSAASILSVS